MTEIADIHKPLCLWLDREGIEYIRARSDKASTIEKGAPDFCLLLPNIPPLFIEAKLAKGALSAAQKRVHARLLAKGFSVHVCRSVAAAVEVVERWRKGEIMRPAQATPNGPERRRYGNAVMQWDGHAWQCLGFAKTDADRQLPPL